MKFIRSTFILVIAVLVPVALIIFGIRVLLSSTFLNIEYRMPGFPTDNYGFSLEERVKWSKLAVQYLVNDSDDEFLGDLTFLDGKALYNERELSHMSDVKKVVKPVLSIGYASWILLLGFGFIAYRIKWQSEYLRGLRLGGLIMIGLICVIGIFAIISFWKFFTIFHNLFFEGDSWLFMYSDTLIRLFPMRFWQDAFLVVGLITLGGSLMLVASIKPNNLIKG
ncbi:MAG: TIGR01906 family membrane protein [Chloroflexota bacterium]